MDQTLPATWLALGLFFVAHVLVDIYSDRPDFAILKRDLFFDRVLPAARQRICEILKIEFAEVGVCRLKTLVGDLGLQVWEIRRG